MATEPNRTSRQRNGAGSWLALALTCGALAALDLTLVRQSLLALGAQHRVVIEAEVTSMLRDLPGAEPQVQRLRFKRTDEVLVTSGDVAVVQSTLAWAAHSGAAPLTQTTGLYGVQRNDRSNVAGYGDRERSGHFEVPPDPPRGRLVLWDSIHPGPLVFTFEASEQRDGIPLLRYRLEPAESDDVDATDTYEALPLVPERYRIRKRVELGTLVVEPRTGRVVDREQESHAWYVLADDPTPLGDAHHLSWRYSAEDRLRLLAEVRAELRLLSWIERVIPGGLLIVGLAAMVTAFRRLLRKRD